jgi:hypothetical protein
MAAERARKFGQPVSKEASTRKGTSNKPGLTAKDRELCRPGDQDKEDCEKSHHQNRRKEEINCGDFC